MSGASAFIATTKHLTSNRSCAARRSSLWRFHDLVDRPPPASQSRVSCRKRNPRPGCLREGWPVVLGYVAGLFLMLALQVSLLTRC